jgi:hypothetical protein
MIKLLTFLSISGINEHMSLERSPEKTNNKPNYTVRRMVAVALVGAVGFVGGLELAHGGRSGNRLPETPSQVAQKYGGRVDGSVTSLTILKGANIRSGLDQLDSGDPNNLITTAKKTFTVETNNDLVVDQSNNGTVFAVPVESLRRIMPDLSVKDTPDGDIYVSSERAIPHGGDSEDYTAATQ